MADAKHNLDSVDLLGLAKELTNPLLDALEQLAEGMPEDLQRFATLIGEDFLLASLIGDEARKASLQAQLLDQLKVLAEINRIRIEPSSWALVERIVRAVIRAAVAGIMSVAL